MPNAKLWAGSMGEGDCHTRPARVQIPRTQVKAGCNNPSMPCREVEGGDRRIFRSLGQPHDSTDPSQDSREERGLTPEMFFRPPHTNHNTCTHTDINAGWERLPACNSSLWRWRWDAQSMLGSKISRMGEIWVWLRDLSSITKMEAQLKMIPDKLKPPQAPAPPHLHPPPTCRHAYHTRGGGPNTHKNSNMIMTEINEIEAGRSGSLKRLTKLTFIDCQRKIKGMGYSKLKVGTWLPTLQKSKVFWEDTRPPCMLARGAGMSSAVGRTEHQLVLGMMSPATGKKLLEQPDAAQTG